MRTANFVFIFVVGLVGSVTQLAAPGSLNAQEPRANANTQIAGLMDWLFGGPQQDPRAVLPRARRPHPADHERKARARKQRHPLDAGGTYRTVCVRLCDGYYFPISFATKHDNFERDAIRCEHQCPSHSRLFFYRNPGQSAEDMVDRNGEPYAMLPNAFRFQSSYVADCTCHGNPWDPEAVARHQAYTPLRKDQLVKTPQSAGQ